jgi:hypothetical protein
MKSTYYPPRSRLPASALSAWFELRRCLRLERIHAPGGVSLWQVALSLVVPGVAFIVTGRLFIGRAVLLAYPVALLFYAAFVGFLVANVLFGLMLAAHAVSILWITRLWVDAPPRWLKVAMVGTVLAVLGMVVYWPCLRYVEENWFMPLRTTNGVVVVQRILPNAINVGDIVAYRLDDHRYGNILIRHGFGIDPVLAVAGDTVEFTATAMLVNGQPRPRQPGMPDRGSMIVPRNHWFVWPQLDIQLNGMANDATATGALLRIAAVPESDYIGKPFRHWFGRRQKIP